MAKREASKHSRAARRGEVESHEAKELAQLPKQETNLKKTIIRSTILSENLLAKKLENKRNKNKKQGKAIKTSRTTNLNGILSTKIEHSIARYNFIKSKRNVGWDKINQDIKVSNPVEQEEQQNQKDLEQQEEDEYVKQFFEQDEPKKAPSSATFNKFALLDESEA